jgi:hypothetical protein
LLRKQQQVIQRQQLAQQQQQQQRQVLLLGKRTQEVEERPLRRLQQPLFPGEAVAVPNSEIKMERTYRWKGFLFLYMYLALLMSGIYSTTGICIEDIY